MFGGELLHLPGARLSSQREARQELSPRAGASSSQGSQGKDMVSPNVFGVEESTQAGLSCPGLQVDMNNSEPKLAPIG